jgi:hypothetical protein
MTEAVYVGAYWGARQESLSACADRLAGYLQALAQIHPLFGQWYRTGSSRRDAKRSPIEATPGALADFLFAGRARRDVEPRTVMEELGYTEAVWNGERTEVGLMIRCGAFSENPRIGNAIVLSLPAPEGPGIELYDRSTLERVFEATVTWWDPEWATAITNRLREIQEGDRVTAGWATFVNWPIPTIGDSDTFEARPMAQGTAIILRASPTEVLDPSINEVRKLIQLSEIEAP